MRRTASWLLPLSCGLVLCAAQDPDPAPEDTRPADDPSWILESRDIDEPFRPYLGNGYMGVEVAGEGTNAGPGGLPAGQHFVAGVFLEDPELDDRPARERICATPMWSDVQLEWGREAFHRDSGEIADYHQTLDLRRGLLRTRCTWRTADQELDIDVQFLISRDDPHLGAIRYSIVPGSDGAGRFRVAIEGKGLAYDSADGPVTNELVQRARGANPDQGLVWLGTENNLGTRLGNALVVAFEGGESKLVSRMGDRLSGQTVYFTAEAGRRYTLDVFATVHTSFDGEDPVGASRRSAQSARELGWDEVLARHETAWAEVWRTDVIVEGEDVVADQRQIRSSLFQLLQSMSDAGDRVGLGPSGLSDGFDSGWVSWSADHWAWTPIAFLHPDHARPLLDFRYRTLDEAESAAEGAGYVGTRWPSMASASGREQGPTTDGEELHVGGWVALAHWNYYLLTRDLAWLRERGWPVIRGTADYWSARATWGDDGARCEFLEVMRPEQRGAVDHCAVATALARRNLLDAIRAAERLGETPDPRWQRVAGGLHPSIEGDANGLVLFPVGYPFDVEAVDERVDELARTVADRPMAYHATLGVLRSGQGRKDAAWREYQRQLERGSRGPFNAWVESGDRPAWSSLCEGAGSSLQQVVFGFAGIRIRDEGVVVRPSLPPGWEGLRLTGIRLGRGVYDIAIDGDDRPSVTLVEGEADVPILDGEGERLVAPR